MKVSENANVGLWGAFAF